MEKEKLVQELVLEKATDIREYFRENENKPIPTDKNELYNLIGEVIWYLDCMGTAVGSIDLSDFHGGRPVSYGYNPTTDEFFVCGNGPLINKGIQPCGSGAVYEPSADDVYTTCPSDIANCKTLGDLWFEIDSSIGYVCIKAYEYLEQFQDEED